MSRIINRKELSVKNEKKPLVNNRKGLLLYRIKR